MSGYAARRVHETWAGLTRKNFSTIMEALAFGYILQVYATRMAQFTPPRKPTTLEYTPRRSAHSLIVRSAVLKVSMESTCEPNVLWGLGLC